MDTKGKKAAAIAYAPPLLAPVVLAAGKDRKADRIIAAARKAGITVVEEPVLAELLETAEPGEYIPPWCWEAMAKILAFVLAKEGK
jgi:type III secretion system FlhB-like substrate exporter